MKKNLEIRNIEKKLYLQFFEDGIWDMVIGFMFFMTGLYVMFDLFFLLGAIVPFIPIISQAKKKITAPRIGLVKFNKSRMNKMTMMFSISVISGVLVFAITFLAGGDSNTELAIWVRKNLLYIIALSWFLTQSILGIGLNYYRLILYGAFTAGAMILSEHYGSFGLNITLAGLLILAIGVILFVRFLYQYPIQSFDETERGNDAS